VVVWLLGRQVGRRQHPRRHDDRHRRAHVAEQRGQPAQQQPARRGAVSPREPADNGADGHDHRSGDLYEAVGGGGQDEDQPDAERQRPDGDDSVGVRGRGLQARHLEQGENEVSSWKWGYGSEVTMRKMSLAALAILILSAPLLAHHGAAALDTGKEITLKGTVTEWTWSNPHCFLQFDAKDDSGKVRNWAVETQNPTSMTQRGFSRTAAQGNEGEIVPLILSTASTSTLGVMAPFIQPSDATADDCEGGVLAGCGINLATPFVVTATTSGTFVVDFEGQVKDQGGECGLEAPAFSFR